MQKNGLKADALKKMFSIFDQPKTKNLTYLDSASTAQIPAVVIEAMVDYYQNYKANIGRGIYQMAEHATAVYENARKVVGKFIGCAAKNIVFTAGTTDSINLVARAWASHQLSAGDEIIISEIEHHSNFVPWQQLAIEKNLKLTIVPVNDQGMIDLQILQSHVSKKTQLVSIVHMSNVTGGCNDVAAIVRIAHSVGAKVLVDAAQSIAHMHIDVTALQVDFLVFSAHKLYGPTGAGVLYAADTVKDQMRPINFGGGMVFSVSDEAVIAKEFPYSMQAGTPNIAGIIGMAAAIEFVQKNIDFDELCKHESLLVNRLIAGLQKVKNIKVVSAVPDASGHVSLVTFYSTAHHAHDIASFLDQHNIAVRAGNHCVQPWHQKHGLAATVRVSFGVYNTMADVDRVVKILHDYCV